MKVGVVTRSKEMDIVGGRGTTTVSPNVAKTLVKVDIDLIQIKKPSSEIKLNLTFK